MADGASSKTVVRYGDDVAAARASYEAEIDQLRADLLKASMTEAYLRASMGIVEKALRDTRRELLEAREEICALHGDEEEREDDSAHPITLRDVGAAR